MVLSSPVKLLNNHGNSFFLRLQQSVPAMTWQSSQKCGCPSTILYSWDEVLMFLCCAPLSPHILSCVFPHNILPAVLWNIQLQTSNMQQRGFFGQQWTLTTPPTNSFHPQCLINFGSRVELVSIPEVIGRERPWTGHQSSAGPHRDKRHKPPFSLTVLT